MSDFVRIFIVLRSSVLILLCVSWGLVSLYIHSSDLSRTSPGRDKLGLTTIWNHCTSLRHWNSPCLNPDPVEEYHCKQKINQWLKNNWQTPAPFIKRNTEKKNRRHRKTLRKHVQRGKMYRVDKAGRMSRHTKKVNGRLRKPQAEK